MLNTKFHILRDYCSLTVQMGNLVEQLDKPHCPTDIYQDKIAELNKTLARIEDTHPWIANVIVAMGGT